MIGQYQSTTVILNIRSILMIYQKYIPYTTNTNKLYALFSFICIFRSGWWSMAQLAAQDYFTRLQASGISPFAHPELAAAFPSGMGMGGVSVPTSSSTNTRQSGGETKSNNKNRKDKKSSNSNNSTGNSNNNKGSMNTSSSSASASSYKVSKGFKHLHLCGFSIGSIDYAFFIASKMYNTFSSLLIFHGCAAHVQCALPISVIGINGIHYSAYSNR